MTGHEGRDEAATGVLRLGLIGDNIAASSAPRLHREAGRLCGREVVYDRLVPAERGMGFDALFDDSAAQGYRGLNITYPYKEVAARRVAIPDPMVAAMGAVNTVVFAAGGAQGYNTDHTGFVAAWSDRLGAARPGTVCLIGSGGVGRAVAFGLAVLGAETLRLVDRDRPRAEALAEALARAAPGMRVEVHAAAEDAAQGAAGLVNCTPVGMVGYEGTPLPRAAMAGARWAFDAVYTPVDTTFLRDAAAEGLAILSGYELFFGQGVDAWRIFSGTAVDPAALRAALARPEAAA